MQRENSQAYVLGNNPLNTGLGKVQLGAGSDGCGMGPDLSGPTLGRVSDRARFPWMGVHSLGSVYFGARVVGCHP